MAQRGNGGPVVAEPARAPIPSPRDATLPATAVGAETLAYRPYLDGLRAVAVYLVVAFHAKVRGFSGGFVGVDIFFVLSGYLVTQLLLRDLGPGRRIRLVRFYARRARRLLPAAFVALVVTAAVYAAVASPAEAANALGGFRSSFLYVANWHFIRQSNDYFAADVNSNPVLHFWSLAVEEQFYLFWPLLLTALYALGAIAGNRRWRFVRIVVAIAFVLSLAEAVRVSHSNLSRAYYGTDTRAYQLLAGAFLALTPGLISRAKSHARLMKWLAVVALACLGGLATSFFHIGPLTRGTAVCALTCVLIVALAAADGGPARGVLSSRTATYLGVVSYGTYLWHWPVIVIATQRFRPNGLALFALTGLVATGIASLSFQVLERPVRTSPRFDRFPRVAVATGLTLSLVGGLLVMAPILRDRSGAVAANARNAQGGEWRVPVPPGLDVEAVKTQLYGNKECYRTPAARCTVVHGTKGRVLLIGDSHAETFTPMLAGVARRHSLTLAVASWPNCPWEHGLVPLPFGAPANLPQRCRAHQDDWFDRLVPEFDPDIVVLVERPLDDPSLDQTNFGTIETADGRTLHFGGRDYETALRDAAEKTIGSLRKDGRTVVVIEPIPVSANLDPLNCLSRAAYFDDCRYTVPALPTPLERAFRSFADGRRVFSVNLDHAVCPYFPICDPRVGRDIVKKDDQHITPGFARQLAVTLDDVLTSNRALDQASSP